LAHQTSVFTTRELKKGHQALLESTVTNKQVRII
jgi:hypothetical protein